MILKRFYFVGFFVLIWMISCKDNQAKISYESEEYFYDSIQDKKVFILNLNDFHEFKSQNPKQFQAYSFFATYNKKSLKSARLVDSIMNDLGSKSKHIYTSLDFYSGAKPKVLNFEHSQNSDLILIYEPNIYQWYKKVNEYWNGNPNGILFVYNDSTKFVNYKDIQFTKDEFKSIKKSLKP